MELIIGNKDYEIHMGIAALNYLDEVYTYEDEASGISLGIGVDMLIANLGMGNVLALVHFIKAGTAAENTKPSNEEIEGFLGGLESDELEKLFDEAAEELKKQPLTRIRANRTMRNMEKAQSKTELKAED